MNFDADRFSARNQLCGIRITEVQRLAARRIDRFHCRERATSGFPLTELHENVRIGSALASTSQTQAARAILSPPPTQLLPARLVPPAELELAAAVRRTLSV